MTFQKLPATAEQAIDGLAISLFLPILLITIPAIATFAPDVAALIVAIPTAGYIYTNIFSPLTRSRRIEKPELSGLLNDSRIQFRVGPVNTSALDLGFRKYIIFDEQDLTGTYQNWRALLGHEYAHLKYGDAKFFHAAGVLGSIAFAAMIFFVFVFLLSTFALNPNTLGSEPLHPVAASLIALVVAGLCAFFILWIRQSLHAREFRADREGSDLDREAFQDWMRRALRHERREKRTSGRLAFSLRWFTHPSFEQRSAALQRSDSVSAPKLRSEVLRSLVFLYGGGALSYFVFEAMNVFFDPDTEIRILGLVLIGLMLLLPLAAACGATSVAAMTCYTEGGWRDAAKFCGAVAITNWVALCIFYFFTLQAGYYEAITAGLTEVPEENMTSGIWQFFVLLSNYGFALLLFTFLTERFFSANRFNILLHICTGALSVPTAFLLTSAQRLFWFSL